MDMSTADAGAPGGVVAAARDVCEGARQAAVHACAGAQTAAQAATAAKVGELHDSIRCSFLCRLATAWALACVHAAVHARGGGGDRSGSHCCRGALSCMRAHEKTLIVARVLEPEKRYCTQEPTT